MSTSTPAAVPAAIVALAKESSVSLAFWFHTSGLAKLIQGHSAGNPRAQEKQSDRDAKVSRIQIFPGDVTIDLSDHVFFTAVAYDRDNTPVGGVKIKWSGQSSVLGRRVRLSQHGEFEATTPGSFSIAAEGAGKTAQVTVIVSPGVRRNLNLTPISTRQVSTRDVPSRKVGSTKELRKSESASAVVSEAGYANGRRIGPAKWTRAPRTETLPAPIVTEATILDGWLGGDSKSVLGRQFKNIGFLPMLPGEGGWGDSNYLSADDPENSVGNPPGAPLDEGAGSGNFQFAAPILGLPGRGIDIALGLAYNSRLWNKAGTQISYDNDRGWPAPGFSLGFGKLLGMGVFNGGMLVDADGTRHSYSGSITEFPWGTNFVGHTTDGTFIDYSYTSGTGGGIVFAQAKLPNGTVINYGAPGPGAVYPTSILDPDGNYIIITYVNNSGPRIQTIVDTLNRSINFYYDANDLLTAITGPGLNNGVRTLVRLHYRQLSLNYSFSGLTPSVRESNPWVIDAIYFPGTNTGYWFGDSESYSTYGMLAKVSERRNMSLSSASLNDQGTITSPGDITREEVYSYPLTTSDPGGSGLTDAPTYSSMTESWTRDGVNTDQAVTNYSSQPNASPRTVTITLPNGTKSVQYSHNAPGSFLDGLVFQDQTLDSGNNVLQSSSVTWAQGAYESPRPTRVEATNELSQMTATEFSYGGVYNQVMEVRHYDYGGLSPLRVTRTQYQNSANYTGQQFSSGHFGRHIFNLPLVVEVFAGDGFTRVSRTDYQYDGQTLTARPDVVQHDPSFNPHAEAEGHCFWDSDWSDPDCSGPCPPESMGCDGHCPQIYHCPYNPATDYRGNVTQVTTYADAVNLTGSVTETRRYDITGNLVTASTSCCEQTSFNYTVDTQYAYPLSQTHGSATDPYAQVTTSATYDFNTGLVRSATDANERISQTSYFSETLRPQTASLSSEAHTDYTYDDTAMSVTESTYLEPHPTHTTIADQNVKLLNGRGQVRQEKALGAGGVWDIVDAIYDNMGRTSQQTRPYRAGDTSQWSTTVYDALSRVVSVQAPEGSTTQTFYNELARPNVASSAPGETTRVRDAWGGERWGRTDAQGRLVEVVEPNPSGNGSVASDGLVTSYTYNTLGNLTTVTQGAQTRSFKYDSLGRLTAQKLAETSATLNDAGAYQTNGGTWSDVFLYDGRSNLISRTDARGVKTIYSYFISGDPNNPDPLNRLQSVSWDTSGFGDAANPILPAATVNYVYRTKDTPTQLRDVTQLSSITTSAISTESYVHDPEGRIIAKSIVVNGRPSMDTDYAYDTLDRVKDVTYPKRELGVMGSPRKVVHHDYDVASRLTGLTVDGAAHASQIVYNASSQTTSLKVGLSGANQITESYAYNSQTGLLDNQTVVRGGATTLLNLSYDYADANGKRTGQLTKITNNLVTSGNRNRSYSYDALGRLVQAKGGPFAAPLWSQTYTYDRYGNRTSVAASGNTARLEKPVEPKPQLPAGLLAFNSSGTLDRAPLFGPDRSIISDSPSGIRLGLKPETSTSAPPALQGEPPVFTDDPLTAGVTIKAVHVTELRTAVNQARSRASLSAANWAESVSPGGLIKAAHIVELRARLDEARAALGMPAASYTDPTLTAGVTVKAVHVQELRQRVTEALTTNFAIPVDGHANLSYDSATNRITTAGFAYDAAGNQVRALAPGGGSQRFQYDAANRLVKVKADDDVTVVASYTYGDSNERLIAEEGSLRTYYACDGKAEYVESGSSTTPQWSKTYIYVGTRLLSTLIPNGSGGESVQYHHPDRLGTRLVTNAQDTNSFEQVNLPFGTALSAESTGATNRRFTTYDRSLNTGLDYALNRHYDPQQGRFTQVDPIGMSASSLTSPQSLNMYSYVGNDPVNRTDPSGLFWGKLLGFVKKLIKVVMVALAVALIVVAIINIGNPLVSAAMIKAAFALAGLLLGAALGPSWLKRTILVAGAAAGIYNKKPGAIWNFSNPGNRNASSGIGSLLGGVGAVTLFLQDLPKPQPTPGPESSSTGKKLSPCVKNRLQPYFPGLDLDKIRIFEGIPAYVIGNNRAYTEGNNIFFAKGQYDPYSAKGIGLIGHETTHVQQYSRGVLKFLVSYGSQYYGRRRWLGMDHDTAYGNISFEIAAGKMGELIEKDLNNMMKQVGGGLPCPR